MRNFWIALVVSLFLSSAANGQVSDGTPVYRKSVEESYLKLQYKTSIYQNLPERGTGLRLGIYQVQAAYGKGATAKNMIRLEKAVQLAKNYNVQLLSYSCLKITSKYGILSSIST